ncbi:MAG: DoxX family protein [Pseudolabrys sp.]
MSDQAFTDAPLVLAAPTQPMQRLADRLAALTPPRVAAELANPPRLPEPSSAVAAALARSAKMADRAARRARCAYYPRKFSAMIVESFISACEFIPYAVAALALRVVIARVFFLSGQVMVGGPRVSASVPASLPASLPASMPISVPDWFNFSFVLPFQVKASTFDMFLTQYGAVPFPPVVAAYLVSYASFILPVMLVLGLGTRFAALGLLIMTVIIHLVMPEALWTSQAYWAAILLVLMSQGPGAISVDHVIRYFTRR